MKIQLSQWMHGWQFFPPWVDSAPLSKINWTKIYQTIFNLSYLLLQSEDSNTALNEFIFLSPPVAPIRPGSSTGLFNLFIHVSSSLFHIFSLSSCAAFWVTLLNLPSSLPILFSARSNALLNLSTKYNLSNSIFHFKKLRFDSLSDIIPFFSCLIFFLWFEFLYVSNDFIYTYFIVSSIVYQFKFLQS